MGNSQKQRAHKSKQMLIAGTLKPLTWSRLFLTSCWNIRWQTGRMALNTSSLEISPSYKAYTFSFQGSSICFITWMSLWGACCPYHHYLTDQREKSGENNSNVGRGEAGQGFLLMKNTTQYLLAYFDFGHCKLTREVALAKGHLLPHILQTREWKLCLTWNTRCRCTCWPKENQATGIWGEKINSLLC